MTTQNYVEEYKIRLLETSIQDIQETIRAMDVKSGFFLVLLCLPFSSFDKIFPILNKLFPSNFLISLLIILVILAWLVSLVSLIYGLIPFTNPKDSIDFNDISKHPKGFFYGGYHVLELGFWRSLVPSANTKNKYNFIEDVKFIQDINVDEYIVELHFERIKLISIRNIKIRRLQQSNIAMLIGFFLIIVISAFCLMNL